MSILDRLKSWYTLEEAAARLSRTLAQSITEHDVIQLASDGHIPVCWFLSNHHDHYAQPVLVSCDYPRGDSTFIRAEPNYDDDGATFGRALSGQFKLPVDIYPPWGWWLLTFIGKGGESGTFWDPIVIDTDDGNFWAFYDKSGSDFFHFPTKEEITIARADIEDFELACRSPQQVSPTIENSKSFESERARLLKHVGMMALTLAEKSGKYKNGTKPNASQIATAVLEILEAIPDADKRGVGMSNLRASISEGLELLNK